MLARCDALPDIVASGDQRVASRRCGAGHVIRGGVATLEAWCRLPWSRVLVGVRGMAAHARGTAFENVCLGALQRWMGMRLYRTGGAGDRGMDLCGWWAPSQALGRGAPGASSAPSAERLRVIVQCKAEAKRVGPAVVRELEGTLIRASWDRLAPHGGEPAASPEKDDCTAVCSQEADWRDGTPQSASGPVGDAYSPASAADAPLVGILASASGFSKQALLHARSSRLPLALVHFVQDEAAGDDVHLSLIHI